LSSDPGFRLQSGALGNGGYADSQSPSLPSAVANSRVCSSLNATPAWPEPGSRLPASPQQQTRSLLPSISSMASSPILPNSSVPDSAAGRISTAVAHDSSANGEGIKDDDAEVRGTGEIPPPWKTWADVVFPSALRSTLLAAGFPAPSSIQKYSWPVTMSGRDLVGIAKTGSGKTLGFLMPCFARLIESRADSRGPPAILVLAPTRELACQIVKEGRDFGGPAGMKAAILYGGAPKGPQLAELRMRPQLVVATPGRLNDLLDPPPGMSLAVDVKSVRYLILDEADRMLDMGFEPQIRKIIGHLPAERQTLMFTATWPTSVRRLASEFQRDPVEARIGDVENLTANIDITQRVEFCRDQFDKENKVQELLRENNNGQAIVFVSTKRMCDTIARTIRDSVAIHGDKDQSERDAALNAFRAGTKRVLVATDVAARGLDVKAVMLVVNFDPAPREEDYVHRIGRTGRAGQKGTAVSLLTNEDGNAARSIAEVMKRTGLGVPKELQQKLDAGELRMGGGGGGGGQRREASRPRILGGSSRRGGMFGGDGDDDFDFGGFTSASSRGRGGNDFSCGVMNDCPT